MNKTVFFILILFSATAFADFNNINKDFENFKSKIHSDFEKYKKIVDEEFSLYKKDIARVWRDVKTSTPELWVEYSKDFKVRRELDFEKGFINISIVSSESDDYWNKFRVQLEDMLSETSTDAVTRNGFLNGVEKRLKSSGMDVLYSDSVDEVKVIGDAVTGKKNPDSKAIKDSALDLLKKGKVKSSPPDLDGKRVISIKIALPAETLQRKASLYIDDVKAYSAERGLDPSLVFAVIHTESTFNPMAKSSIPAYGLMQVVPRTAGLDATELVYGRKILLAPSFLYKPRNNIKIGVAYLSVLYKRYMRSIKNPKSRLYCSIAAYNTGSSNVGRAFIRQASIKKATPVINKLKPDEVYAKLVKNLPQNETRQYLKKVTRRMKYYQTKQE